MPIPLIRDLTEETPRRAGSQMASVSRRPWCSHLNFEPLPIGAVTHLIMILNAADEPIPRQARGGRAMAAIAMLAVAPIKDKGVLYHFP